MKDQTFASYHSRKVVMFNPLDARGYRCGKGDFKDGSGHLQYPVAHKSANGAFSNNIDINQVEVHFPSVVSFTEHLPLVGHVSHIATPESTSNHVASTSQSVRDVHISGRLMEEFMELASDNTKKNLETCGILGAFLRDQTFYVTTLIIPKQETTSNSCQALKEEEIHSIQAGQSLFPVGWIHTHPSQTCFLSSVDLHTQYSYQVMLPEAIAIVMAPTDPTRSYGIFRLTDPIGISVIQSCHDSGGFHLHSETCDDGTPIYESCSNVYINPNLRICIIPCLRNKKTKNYFTVPFKKATDLVSLTSKDTGYRHFPSYGTKDTTVPFIMAIHGCNLHE